ncbi:GAP family protein [Modestobacter sp. SYSU DS0875]
MTVLLPVLGLAVVDSLNPSAILVAILLTLRGITSGTSLVKPVGAYLAGIVTANVALGAALVLGVRSLLSATGGLPEGPTAYRVQLVAGLVLLAIGVLTPTRPRKARQERSLDRSAVKLFLLGVAITLVELTTALPYLAAVGLISSSGLPASAWVPMLVLYGVVVVLPPLAIAVLGAAGGPRFREWAERNAARLRNGGRGLVLTVIFLVGLFLTADAAYYFDFFGLVDVGQAHPAR